MCFVWLCYVLLLCVLPTYTHANFLKRTHTFIDFYLHTHTLSLSLSRSLFISLSLSFIHFCIHTIGCRLNERDRGKAAVVASSRGRLSLVKLLLSKSVCGVSIDSVNEVRTSNACDVNATLGGGGDTALVGIYIFLRHLDIFLFFSRTYTHTYTHTHAHAHACIYIHTALSLTLHSRHCHLCTLITRLPLGAVRARAHVHTHSIITHFTLTSLSPVHVDYTIAA
jgi:hypothetical protein